MSEMITYMFQCLSVQEELNRELDLLQQVNSKSCYNQLVDRTVVCLHSRRDFYTSSRSPPHPQLIAKSEELCSQERDQRLLSHKLILMFFFLRELIGQINILL